MVVEHHKRVFRFAVPLLLLAAAVAAASAVQSPTNRIVFGTVPLTLGMQDKVVLEQLRERYRVISTSSDNWAVLEHDPALPAVGSIAFKAGRLAYVNRTWVQVPPVGTSEADPIALARALYGVISQFVKENRRECTIGTHEGFAPGAEGRTAYISCGGKEIRVAMFRTERSGWVATVDEVMPAVP